jgi:hypothetical protein
VYKFPEQIVADDYTARQVVTVISDLSVRALERRAQNEAGHA